MTTIRLRKMPYAHACVKLDDGLAILVSYKTAVAEVRNGWLTVFGLYSMTTRKHIGAFVDQFAHTDYQTAKQIYEQGMEYNIRTGETRPI